MGFRVRVRPPGPVARALVLRDVEVISPSMSRQLALTVGSGEGCNLIDVDGNKYLDFTSNMLCCNIGYGHPRVIEAARRQIEVLIHSPYAFYYTGGVVDLAERLSKIVPVNGKAGFFFCSSGDEAVEGAAKMVEWHMRRNAFLAFVGSYHGDGFVGGALSAVKGSEKRWVGGAVRVIHLPAPYCYRCPFHLDSSSCGSFCLGYVEDEVLERVVSPGDIAALFIQPIFTEGGCLFPPRDYFSRLRRLADEEGFLLVDDESLIGVGRLGSWFAIDHWRVKPDVLIAPNSLAEGFPLGVIASSRRVMDWVEGVHRTYLGGNLVASRVALRALEVLEGERLLENANREGMYLLKRMRELEAEYEGVGDVRGRGLYVGVEILSRDSTSFGVEEARRILKWCWRRGLVLSLSGEATLRLTPPLTVSRGMIDSAVEVLEGAFKEILGR